MPKSVLRMASEVVIITYIEKNVFNMVSQKINLSRYIVLY